jgi:antirestriction protein ArdC
MFNPNDGTQCDLSELKDVREDLSVPILKYYNVFHEDDVIGLNEPLPSEEEIKLEKPQEIINNYLKEHCEIALVNTVSIPRFDHGTKCIYIPPANTFKSIELYYSVVFHEMIHSTLLFMERKCTRGREELVAEIGAAYLCGRAGIEIDKVINDVTSYCANWASKLRAGGIKDLVWASSRAEKAVKFILNEREDGE